MAQGAPENNAAFHREMLHQAFDLKHSIHRHAALLPRLSSTGARQQATKWFDAISRNGGGSSEQRRSANGQRGAKRQPFGWRSELGTMPSMVDRRSRSSSRRGIEPSSPMV